MILRQYLGEHSNPGIARKLSREQK